MGLLLRPREYRGRIQMLLLRHKRFGISLLRNLLNRHLILRLHLLSSSRLLILILRSRDLLLNSRDLILLSSQRLMDLMGRIGSLMGLLLMGRSLMGRSRFLLLLSL
jgi:hypothetical protein